MRKPVGNIAQVDDSPSTIFVSGKGRAYTSWVDIGGRSNSYSTGQLIENPAFIVESILRDMMSRTTGEINLPDFDACSTALTDYISAFSWDSKEFAISRIGEIAQDFGSVFHCKSDGKFSLTAIAERAHQVRFMPNDMLGNDSLKVNRTSSDLIMNELIFRYKYNYVKSRFDEEIECTTESQTGLSSTGNNYDTRVSGFRDVYTSYVTMLYESRATYNTTRRMTVESRHIRDNATAVLAAQHVMDWHALHRYIVEFDCPLKKLEDDANHTTADIEPGDFAIVNHPLLPTDTSGISGTDGLSDLALFIVTKAIFEPKTQTTHFVLRETPYKTTDPP